MSECQSALLKEPPVAARFLRFSLKPGASADATLEILRTRPLGDAVVGLGATLIKAAGASVEGMRDFPVLSGCGVSMPSTPSALWIWLRGEDRGELLHRGRHWCSFLGSQLQLEQTVEAFRYREGRDLTGYVDGTENPTGEKAQRVALVSGKGPGLDGSSFVVAQRWKHNLGRFEAFSRTEQDNVIGRRLSDNEEFDDAPASAHVKRAAQESFDPEAFVLRRSMPWSGAHGAGLVFIAFANSFDPFEAIARRMLGLEDGIVDAMFSFTQPLDGAYYWCPPVHDDCLDLRAL